MKSNYYVSSLFWSTLSRILNAVLGFITVPLLLRYYGKAEYGLLSIATACNGYMQLLDLGMNTGAVKFYSQWKADGNNEKVFRVAQSNITFYIIIATINTLMLLAVAIWGESWFSVTHAQFVQIRICLFIIALFCLFSWVTTVFNQLLIADKQMTFTMQVQCVQTLLKAILVVCVIYSHIALTTYFFWLTALVSMAFIPYAYKCRRDNLITSFRPRWYWEDFKIVIMFSLFIFALSLFQVTATQSRPIILSMFAQDGATAVAEFRILEVVPQFIVMIGGTFSGIFLPKTAEMVAHKDEVAMRNFAYKWTTYTTAVVAFMCFPFILCAKETLSAYVGSEYANLSPWLIIWCATVLIQMHTTPGNALVLAHGKTKLLVQVTALGCIVSMVINVLLCKFFNVGSAILAYFLYVCFIIGLYYISFYKKLLKLSRRKMLASFALPSVVAFLTYVLVSMIPFEISMFGSINERIAYILMCLLKTSVWAVPYVAILHFCKIIDFKQLRK